MKQRLLIYLVLFPIFLYAQEDLTIVGLKSIAKIESDGIKLRWAVDDPYIWQQALSKGYLLEKAILINGQSIETLDYSVVTGENIVKWNESKWDNYQSKFQLEENTSEEIKYAHVARAMSEEDIYLDGTETFEQQMEYKKALETQFLYALISADLSWTGALVQGLGYFDGDVISGETYVYRLSLGFSLSSFSTPTFYLKVKNEQNPKLYLQELIVEEKDEKVTLSWKEQQGINSYFIESSYDGKVYNRDNTSPFYQMRTGRRGTNNTVSYSVDTLINYHTYNFKVKGNTSFGDEVLIGEAEGMPRDLTPPTKPIMLGVDHSSPNIATIKWKVGQPESSDLDGFVIGRSNEDFGQYYRIHEGLIPSDWRSFEDQYFNKDGNNYYRIEAVDTSGNKSRSNSAYLTLVDSVAPAIPIPISGIMDSLGIVTLELEPQTEKDFMGYRVYKANDLEHEFSVVQETYNDTIVEIARQPTIIDTSTLESLTPFVYYHITALDYHYNESKFSAVIEVPRPDKYPPVPPLIKGYKVADSGVELEFIASTSIDVVNNYLFSKPAYSEEWILIDSIGTENTTYSLSFDGDSNGVFEYGLKAVDNSSLESDFSNVVKIKHLYKPRQLDLDIICTHYIKLETTVSLWDLKEEIPTEVYHAITMLVDGNIEPLGITKYRNGHVFESKLIPTYINVKSKTASEEFLVSDNVGCTTNSEVSDIQGLLKQLKQ